MDCQSCKWSGRMGEEQELVCRRYPPRQVEIGRDLVAGTISAPTTAWPVVAPLDWCGEFKIR